MFLDERWITLLLFITLVGVLLHAPALTALGVLSLALVSISGFLRRRVLNHVTYERRFNETHLFMGEILEISCNLKNRGRLPIVSLYADDSAPAGFQLVGAGSDERFNPDDRVNLAQHSALKPGEHTSRQTRVRAMKRGYFSFGSVYLRAFDILGLSMFERIDTIADKLIVYPRVFSLEALGIPTNDPFGQFAAVRRLIEDPSRIMGARDYRHGDPFRQVHWKATAHAGRLQTRVCEHTSEPTAVIMLNVSTFLQDWRGSDVERFEWALSVAGSLAVWAGETGVTLGLSSNGTAPYLPSALRVRPRRSPGQLATVLESLAVMYSFALSSFEIFLLTEQRHLPQGATQIVVTALVTPEIATALLRLYDLGKNIILISVDRDPPDVTYLPFPVFHVPPLASYWTGGYWDVNGKPVEPVVLSDSQLATGEARA
ncbi:MAG TPA: DUF58 domain-containing protein [Armatimonadota bacterium]